ncbi:MULTISPECIES: DNA cytosine methyltransferase [Pseudomonas]|jgi:DNA (cytosine-5)-methyltransferase 1|uniref:DNA cytosine methyltransferase n=1 Tax=Pseudomonas TaxID=286 RepID=UPI0018E7048F|nr:MULTISPECIES: DNA cytosine methyltransferase [Pseudomonas]MBJ2213970.1 DNA cytosine methyltransferase [Pseudomonas carnis]MBP5947857.1 DNA cytosine methyltransferase [Pseudomonas sp. P9(2020)]
MTTVITTHIQENRTVPRLWLEGAKLAHAGVEIGVQYFLSVSKQLRRIELRPAPNDFAGKTFKVSTRTRNDRVSPLMEIRDAILNEVFEVGTKVRVAIQKGRIIISQTHIAIKIQERVNAFLDKLKNGEPLSVISLFHGGGVLDKAMHHGLQRGGLDSFVKVGVELEGNYIDASLVNNPELWREESIVLNGDVRDINLMGSGIPQCQLLYGGVPCTGASIAGVAKNQLSCAEEHSTAGTLFIDFIDWVKATNPAIVVLENVVEYAKSVGMTVIRSVLTGLGYQVSETTLDGAQMGSLEKRKRLCMVATTPGVCGMVDFNELVPTRVKEEKIADVLEYVPADSDRWKPFDYLADKEVRDIAAGKGFKRQLLTGEEDGCGVIGRGYAKARSTEPFIISPWNPSLSRLLTPAEHAAVKTAPVSLVRGVSETTAHEILGQSVVYEAVVAIGELIARTVKGLVKTLSPPVIQKIKAQEDGPNPVKSNQQAGETLPLFSLTA